MNADAPLPEFDNPPVIEVVCGVLFRELEQLRAAHLGKLWGKLQPQYTGVREVSPLAPTIEVFGEAPAHQLRLTDVPPLARTWLMTPSENGIVQIQRDRFLHNWKKVAPENEYPRYSKVIQMFWDHLSTFREFLDEYRIGTLHPVQARTPLGLRLREIRRRIEASGTPLLDWDGIDLERKERRGERNSE